MGAVSFPAAPWPYYNPFGMHGSALESLAFHRTIMHPMGLPRRMASYTSLGVSGLPHWGRRAERCTSSCQGGEISLWGGSALSFVCPPVQAASRQLISHTCLLKLS